MILAKVLGNVVATQKNHRYENARVMMCEQDGVEVPDAVSKHLLPEIRTDIDHDGG